MTLTFQTPNGPMDLDPERCVVAGWTGRDATKVQHHIDELAAIGVPPPSRTPLPYEVAPSLLIQGRAIHCVGADSSGEAEPAILFRGGRRYLTLASDHTDRALEGHSVALSKQVCAKPIAREAWPMESIGDAEALELRSWVAEGGGWVPYQDGTLAAMLPLDEIVAASGLDGSVDAVLLCGTLPAIGGVRAHAAIRCELRDPARDAAIGLEYRTVVLPANA